MAADGHFNPFPGLRSFEPDEDYLFFGREAQADELLRRLRVARFLGVVGGSGSGKSSLVRSGLIPSLHGGFMVAAGSSWRVAVLRPGGDPVHSLATALSAPEALGGDLPDADLSGAMLDATLRRNGRGLIEAVRQSHILATDNVLVLVDQFEELFRFKQARAAAGGRDEAVAFVRLLIEAARQTVLPIYVVLTMRSEFIGRCAEIPGLAEVVNEGQYLVPRLTRDELRLAITGPIAVGGGQIAPRLVTRVLNEVGDDPDQLPVLQHALMRTWDHWASHRAGRGPIDVEDYEAIGTMKNALSVHADEAFAELRSEREQRLAETAFKALTDTTAEGLGLRRPCEVQTLCEITVSSHEEMGAVLDRFRMPGRTFLVPPVSSPLTPSTIVDLSHESLMRLWSRLIAWTEEEGRSARIYRRLGIAAGLHARGEAALWRDPELQLGVNWRDTQRPTAAWAKRYDDEFERATAFLAASQQARDAGIAAEAAAAAERRRRERTIRVLAVAVLAISLLGSAGVFWLGRRAVTAQRAADEAQGRADRSRMAADEAVFRANELGRQVDKSRRQVEESERTASIRVSAANEQLALANEAVVKGQRRANANLLAIEASESFYERPAAIGASALAAIEAIRLDSRQPLTLARRTLMDVLRLLPPLPANPLEHPHAQAVTSMTLDRTGRLLLTSSKDQLVLWDFGTRQIRRTFSGASRGVLSGDGRWVAGITGPSVDVWDAATGTRVAQLPHKDPFWMVFSPDGSILATISDVEVRGGNFFSSLPEDAPFVGGSLNRFNTTEWVRLPATTSLVSEVVFSPTGEMVLVTEDGISSDGKLPIRNTSACRSLSFSADGNAFAICLGGLARVNLVNSELNRLPMLERSDALHNVCPNSHKGRVPAEVFVGRRASGAVTAFDTSGVEFLRLPEPVTSLAVPPTGEWIATGNQDGRVQFWQLRHGMTPPPLPYKGGVHDLTFSHDEKWLAMVAPGGELRIYDVEKRRPIQTIKVPERASQPRFSPDDSVLVVDDGPDLRVIRTPKAPAASADPGLAWTAIDRGPNQPIRDVTLRFTFSEDSNVLLIAREGSLQHLRIAADRRTVSSLSSLEFKTDGQVFVSADRRWIGTGAKGANEPGPGGSLWDVTGSAPRPASQVTVRGASWIKLYPGDHNALSGDLDGGEWWRLDTSGDPRPTLRILERRTGRLVGTLPHPLPVNAVALSRNGTWIAAGTATLQVSEFGNRLDPSTADSATYLWPWDERGLIALACSLIPNNLTPAEWKARNLESFGLGPRRDTCPSRAGAAGAR